MKASKVISRAKENHREAVAKAGSGPEAAARIKAAEGIVRVADIYYQEYEDESGNIRLIKRDRVEMKRDGVDFAAIPKYKGFAVEHSFTNYRRAIGDLYNLSQPYKWKAVQGEFPTIMQLLRHIFGEQLQTALDYYQILITRPDQKLPVVVLVSKEQQTGKSTLLHFNKSLFGSNCAFVNVSEYAQQFNALYASKLVICIDESALNADFLKERLKNDSTADRIQLRKMHKEHEEISFYGKFFLASNREHDFAKIDGEDIRFWVRKVPSLGGAIVPDFEKKLVQEIPAFLYFLLHRELRTKQAMSRQWFSREDLVTDALRDMVEESRSECCKSILEVTEDIMAEHSINDLYLTATDLVELLRNKYELSQISRALRTELQLIPTNCRFEDHEGRARSGRAYHFELQNIDELL